MIILWWLMESGLSRAGLRWAAGPAGSGLLQVSHPRAQAKEGQHPQQASRGQRRVTKN